MSGLALLLGAIASEVTATTALKLSDGFSRWFPSTVVVVGYGLSFYLLALVLKQMSMGVAYALWAGLGTAAIAIVGVLLFDESLGPQRIAGIALVIGGVVLLNLPGAEGTVS